MSEIYIFNQFWATLLTLFIQGFLLFILGRGVYSKQNEIFEIRRSLCNLKCIKCCEKSNSFTRILKNNLSCEMGLRQCVHCTIQTHALGQTVVMGPRLETNKGFIITSFLSSFCHWILVSYFFSNFLVKKIYSCLSIVVLIIFYFYEFFGFLISPTSEI